MHVQAHDYIAQAVQKHGPITGDVAELGSCDVNGGVKALFPQARSYFGVDITAGPNVDLAIDAADWMPAQQYNCIVSTETFEHTSRWPEILAVAAKALAPDGLILITCAANPRKPHSAHTDRARVAYGEYYGNVDRQIFKRAADAAGLIAEIIMDYEHGDLYATCRLKEVV